METFFQVILFHFKITPRDWKTVLLLALERLSGVLNFWKSRVIFMQSTIGHFICARTSVDVTGWTTWNAGFRPFWVPPGLAWTKMASNASTPPTKQGPRQTGIHCIGPGCHNYFYNKKKKVHYHRLPLKNPVLLKQWLQKMKRSDPPVNTYARVCSEHFLDSDYVYVGSFDDSGAYKSIKSANLKDGAVPFFDFSSYSTGNTDCPSKSTSEVSRQRSDRLMKRTKQKEVGVQLITTEIKSYWIKRACLHLKLNSKPMFMKSDKLYHWMWIDLSHADR